MPNTNDEILEYLKEKNIPQDEEIINSFVNLAAYYNRINSESEVGTFYLM